MIPPLSRRCAAILVLVCASAGPQAARADIVLYSDLGPGGTYDTTTSYPIGNDFSGGTDVYLMQFTTTGGPADLSSITVALGEIGALGDSVNVSLLSDSGGSPGSVLETSQAAVTSDFFAGGSLVTATSASPSLLLQSGTTYWVEVSAVTPANSFGWFFNSTGASGTVGSSLDGGMTFGFNPGTLGAFSVNGTPQVAAPEPNYLYQLCMLGFAAVAWRRFRAAKR